MLRHTSRKEAHRRSLFVLFGLLTGKPCVMGTSMLKRRILARNRVQTRIGSFGWQNTQPTLEGSR